LGENRRSENVVVGKNVVSGKGREKIFGLELMNKEGARK